MTDAATPKYEAIRYEQADGVATITLNRPDVHNAMNQAMRRELLEVFTRLRTDDTVRAVVVTGGGDKAFSAGADIREFLEPPVPTQFREARRRVDFRREMERCPQPIIAAIRGYAFGGGLELALACDIRVAAEDAQLGLTEINLAIIPGGGGTQRLPRLVGRGKALEMILTGMRIPAAEDAQLGLTEINLAIIPGGGGTQRLPRLVGRGKALEMIMTGMRIPAAEALRIGLVERVVPLAEHPAAAQALARTIADKAPVALRYAKEAVVGGIGLPLEDGIRLENDLATLLRTTEDRIEGAKAFVEKRKPRWSGK